jgi:type IV pilus assembly protein PilQ
MRAYALLFLLLIITGVASRVEAQGEAAVRRAAQGKVVNNDELVSFKSDVPYTKAIQSLGELSKKLEGKLVIDRSPMQGTEKGIGINIESMYWKDALELILRSNQLWYNDYPEYMEVVSFDEVGRSSGGQAPAGVSRVTSDISSGPSGSRTIAGVDSSEYYAQVREVSITGVIFDLNRTKLTQVGVSFNVFRGRDLNLGISVTGASQLTKTVATASVAPTGADLPVTLDAALAIFEGDQLGEVIARPQMTVRSGSNSQFQVGRDFAVLERDFSGNTVQKFYPTGTILTVRPKIWKVGDIEFIDISYKVEKSDFTSEAGTSIINKTQASGTLLLLNGEEGYVAGMYSNDEVIVRQGVPLLKDLPWWVFGLRYLFGFDSKQVIKRELLLLLKADILPTIEERAVKPKTAKNVIKDSIQEMDKDLKRRVDK